MSFTGPKDVKAHVRNMEADTIMGLVELPRITAQQRYYVAARIGGLSMSAAARECGTSPATASRWEKEPAIQQHMDHYLEEFSSKVLPRVEFSTEQAHQMYMNAYHSAGTSAEMTRATDSLVKLHKLLEVSLDDRRVPSNAKQLEGMDTQALLRYAAIGLDSLQPGEVIEGEFSEED